MEQTDGQTSRQRKDITSLPARGTKTDTRALRYVCSYHYCLLSMQRCPVRPDLEPVIRYRAFPLESAAHDR